LLKKEIEDIIFHFPNSSSVLDIGFSFYVEKHPNILNICHLSKWSEGHILVEIRR